MKRYKEPLDTYDRLPADMTAYLRYNGWHFNNKMADFAIGKMRKLNTATNKMERIERTKKDQIDEILTRNGITLENNEGHDYIYVYHMAVADFYGKSLQDERSICQFVKDVVDDADQADGFILNRFYADCVRAGVAIPWDEML